MPYQWERMRMMKRCLMLTMMCLLLSATLALADGDGPTRKMSGQEAAAFNALKSTFQRALPKTPANYTLAIRYGNDVGEIMLPEAIKPGQMARMSFTANYTLNREYQAVQQRASFTDRAKGTPEQQARLAVLDAKDAELTNARNKTRDRGEKERIRAELKTVRNEGNKLRDQVMADYQAWVASGGATAAIQNADRTLPAKELTIRAFINQEMNLNDKATPYKLPGFPLAFEQKDGCQDYNTCCITVLLGAFEREADQRVHALQSEKREPRRAHEAPWHGDCCRRAEGKTAERAGLPGTDRPDETESLAALVLAGGAPGGRSSKAIFLIKAL